MGLFGRLFPGSKQVDPVIGAWVLLSGPAPELSEVVRHLRGRGKTVAEDEGRIVVAGPSEKDEPTRVSMTRLDPMPAPLLDELVRSAWWWSDAGSCRGHERVVALQAAEGTGDRLLRRRAVSEVAAAVARLSPTVGVVWTDAAGLYEPEEFCEHVEASSGDHPPTPFWVSLRLLTTSRGQLLVSTGLEAFGSRELEIEASGASALVDPQQLAAVLHGLIRVMLVKGGVLSVGDKIPLSETVRLHVVEVGASSIPGRRDAFHLSLA